jgi:carbamoyl-phosphate synthase large subunit
MRVLVTGVGGPAGTNVVNHSPERIEMVACDADPNAKKRLLSSGKPGLRFYQVPPARKEKEFVDAVRGIVSRESIDAIIPTVDEELMVFSRNREGFGTRIVVSPFETINTCNDKYLFYERFREYGFSPRYVVTGSRKELESLGSGKILMKPRIGRGSRGIRIFGRIEDVPDEDISKNNVFCEYLPGYEYTSDVLCDLEGNPLVIIPRKRLEVKRGVCVRGRLERNERIIGNIRKMCEVLKFTGPINIQFKLDSGGEPRLVEANPRFSGGLPITIQSGVNTLEILYDLLESRKISSSRLVWQETEGSQEIQR